MLTLSFKKQTMKKKKINLKYGVIFKLFLVFILASCSNKKDINIYVSDDVNSDYIVEQLSKQLQAKSYKATLTKNLDNANIILTTADSDITNQLDFENNFKKEKSESYIIKTVKDKTIILGSDYSGLLYGVISFNEKLQKYKRIPTNLNITDGPEMVLRGTVIGLQKPEYLPGRRIYEYPLTPESFPWFYDKGHWIEYLDMMVENRFNSLYLWNGHPFASLVKLDDYPYAVEVDDETFKKNEEIYNFITTEAAKRGIWIIQTFYNIIVSQPFAEHHNMTTQERNREITPLLSDYTQKSISAFIEKYPHVGLMVTLGEAMSGIENEIKWFTETIIPGVKDGLQAINSNEEPPIVLRGHDTDAVKVMQEAKKIYSNLYTVHKYNGESLTTYEPQDSWAEIHQNLSSSGTVHISNVHILANLEPFRYSSPDFIQKSIVAMNKIQKANGLHLYPQSSYWDWPYSADKTDIRLKQIDRDWMWYKAWGRYAWNKERNRKDEVKYWAEKISEQYKISHKDSEQLLTALEEVGEIAPKLLRAYGISDGNRQTLTLGMFMSQLVNPYKYRVYDSFIKSSGPDKEILIDWAKKEWNNEPHHGELPMDIANEVENHALKAVEAVNKIDKKAITKSDELKRVVNDIMCYYDLAYFYSEKVKSATEVLNYKYSNDINYLDKADLHLANSLDYFKSLVDKTEDTYLYANSMQIDLRRIPISGKDGKNKHWSELLPHYQEEYDNFKRNLIGLKQNKDISLVKKEYKAFKKADVKILNKNNNFIELKEGAKIYSNKSDKIQKIAPELKGLSALVTNSQNQINNGTSIEFECSDSIKIVVGYFNGHSYTILDPPTLETNALANERGQADIKIANALSIENMWPINIYTYDYEPGIHTLKLDKGLVLILGFIDGEEEIISRDAGIVGEGEESSIDWLFY